MQRLAMITGGGDVRGALTSVDARDVSVTLHPGGTMLGTAHIRGRVRPREWQNPPEHPEVTARG